MTAVAGVLPRYWDGHRLLRFLAGLAMLALACTAPLGTLAAGPLSAPSAPAVVRTVAVAESTVAEPAAAEIAGAPMVRVAEPVAPRPPLTPAPAVLLAATAVVLLGTLAPRIRADRAPPAV